MVVRTLLNKTKTKKKLIENKLHSILFAKLIQILRIATIQMENQEIDKLCECKSFVLFFNKKKIIKS